MLLLTPLLINEFVCNPEDSEPEWIEFYNPGPETADLSTITIEDATNKPKKLSGKIKPGIYFVIENPPIKLNNDKDTIILKNNKGEILDQVTYDKKRAPPKGKSLGRLNGQWKVFSHPTKSARNKIINTKPKAVIEIQNGETTKTVPLKINLDGRGSFDPDKDNLQFFWDFGNTITEEKENPKSHTFPEPGKYTISLTVTDIWGEKDTAFLEINALPKPMKSKTTKIYKNGDLCDQIEITEIMPNPKGSDDMEWIELYNASDKTVNLGNWQLDDSENRSKPYIFDNIKIEPREFLVIEREKSKIALNNDQDEVRLLDFQGNLIDKVFYEKSKEGFSYTKIEGVWEWLEDTTKGRENPKFVSLEGEITESSPEKNLFYLNNLKILYPPQKIDPALAKITFTPQTHLKITAKKLNEETFELRDFEIISTAPEKIATSKTNIKLFLLAAIAVTTSAFYIHRRQTSISVPK